jgi:hypothetical protein
VGRGALRRITMTAASTDQDVDEVFDDAASAPRFIAVELPELLSITGHRARWHARSPGPRAGAAARIDGVSERDAKRVTGTYSCFAALTGAMTVQDRRRCGASCTATPTGSGYRPSSCSPESETKYRHSFIFVIIRRWPAPPKPRQPRGRRAG